MTARRASPSRFLSLILRHEPARIGLSLDREGWADIDELLQHANRHGVAITREALLEAVASNDKQRFALDAAGRRIRANQGHSIAVDLGLEPLAPPDRLYHGTATRFLASIRRRGLVAGSRQHVHLSDDPDTARGVGARHGLPQVLTVRAGALHATGQAFFRAANGVWLTAAVPPRYLEFPHRERGAGASR